MNTLITLLIIFLILATAVWRRVDGSDMKKNLTLFGIKYWAGLIWLLVGATVVLTPTWQQGVLAAFVGLSLVKGYNSSWTHWTYMSIHHARWIACAWLIISSVEVFMVGNSFSVPSVAFWVNYLGSTLVDYLPHLGIASLAGLVRTWFSQWKSMPTPCWYIDAPTAPAENITGGLLMFLLLFNYIFN